MKVIVTFFLLLSALNSVTAAKKCNADNCARAVTGTARPSLASRLVDCSRFQAASTVTITTTIGGGIEARGENLMPRQPAPTVPAYASACSGTVRYSSACSCAGFTQVTVTTTANPPAQTCNNGAPPSVCDDPHSCFGGAGGTSCYCLHNAEGGVSCASISFCPDSSNTIQSCSVSSDCPANNACIVNTCCSTGICAALICEDESAPSRLFRKGGSAAVPEVLHSGGN